ncbi:MAG: T9SS type A sorting domain-containing protein [Bacteroidia bacterium]
MKLSFIILVFLGFNLNAQSRRDYWAFGDSAGLQFNGAVVNPITASIVSNEVAASIADNAGNPLFSIGAPFLGAFRLSVFSWNNQLMTNGDTIYGEATLTQCAIIIPLFGDSNMFYIIHQGTPQSGIPLKLYYSIVDMSLDSGKGAVIIKNMLIDSTNQLCEKRVAVKHGNGRDWWIISHSLFGDLFVKYLISNDSIIGPFYQNIGSMHTIDPGGQMAISPDGDKLFLPNFSGIADLFDFDRCTGDISNWHYIGDATLSWERYYGGSFSYKNLLYYSSRDSVWQIDAKDSNPASTKVLLWADNNGDACIGQHQLAPDNNIYISSYRGIGCSAPNTIYDSLNMNLTVITNPDIQGVGCSLLPYNISLGGHRTFSGLPNIPFYNLGALSGSICDTLTGIVQLDNPSPSFTIFPNPVTDILYIRPCVNNSIITIYNCLGSKLINVKNQNQINVRRLAEGVYVVEVIYKEIVIRKRFIKQ